MAAIRVHRAAVITRAAVRVLRAAVNVTAPAKAAIRVYRSEATTVGSLGAAIRVYRSAMVVAGTLTANAGKDLTVDALDVIQLDGTASTGLPDTYVWTQTGGTTVVLHDPGTARPSFVAPGQLAGSTLTFSLVVKAGASTSAADTITVAVGPSVEWLNIAGTWTATRTDLITATTAAALAADNIDFSEVA